VPPANLGAARPASLRRTALTAGRDIGIGLLVALGLLLALSSNRTARLPRLLVPLPARVTPGEDAPPSG
jgi:hypothetical protein